MTGFIKVCTEFIPVSVCSVIQVDIHAVLDANKKIWFTKAHKKELLELVLEKAKSRLLQGQVCQSVEKKEGITWSPTETKPEILAGKNVKLALSFRKCGVRYHSVVATAEGLGDAKAYQPLSCSKEKVIVYSYPLDRSSETCNAAAASPRHRLATEDAVNNPANVTEGSVLKICGDKTANFSHGVILNSSETVVRNQEHVTSRSQLVSSEVSEVDKCNLSATKFNLSAAKKKKKSAAELLSGKKKHQSLSQFKFRRTRAIQVLCHRASPFPHARLVHRRSRSLVSSCTEKEEEEEDKMHNGSMDVLEKTSRDITGEKLKKGLDKKSKGVPKQNNKNILDEKSGVVFIERLRNDSEKHLKDGLGAKSTEASMEKSETKCSLNLGNVTLIHCAGRNEVVETATVSETGELDKNITMVRSEKNVKQNCVLPGKAVSRSNKREHDESDSVVNALSISKKLCITETVDELRSSGELPRHHIRDAGQLSGNMLKDKQGQVTGAEAIKGSSDFKGRKNVKDDIRASCSDGANSRQKSNSGIRHFPAGDLRPCSSDDFTDCSNMTKGSECESESCSALLVEPSSKKTVLTNRSNHVSHKILDFGNDFKTASLKTLPVQKSRRLATKKRNLEKFLAEIDHDLSPDIKGKAPTEFNKMDLGSTVSERPVASSRFNFPKEISASSEKISTRDDGLSTFPSDHKNQTPVMSTQSTQFTLEKDAGPCFGAHSQPAAKILDSSLSSGNIIPSHREAPVSSLGYFSTECTATANGQSNCKNSVGMVINTQHSDCDPCIPMKTQGHSDVIVIESDKEDDIEAEIRAVRAVSDLTACQLRHLVFNNETYLRKIFQGKIPCRRHEDYKAGGEKRRALSWNLPVGIFSDEQYSQILSSLKELFCKRHEKYLDYMMMVLLPETLIRIFMFVHDLNYEAAESRIEENAMELSQINRFNFSD